MTAKLDQNEAVGIKPSEMNYGQIGEIGRKVSAKDLLPRVNANCLR